MLSLLFSKSQERNLGLSSDGFRSLFPRKNKSVSGVFENKEHFSRSNTCKEYK